MIICNFYFTSSSIRGSAWPSPLSADSPQSVDAHQTVPKHDTRGKTLQKQARLMSTTKFGTSNVLTNAKAWGISVVHIDKVLDKLAEYGPSKAEKQPSIKELRSRKKASLEVCVCESGLSECFGVVGYKSEIACCDPRIC